LLGATLEGLQRTVDLVCTYAIVSNLSDASPLTINFGRSTAADSSLQIPGSNIS